MPADLSQHPAVRLARYRRDHPEIDISKVDGVYRAVIPLGGNSERILAGYDETELLGKLDRAGAGG